MNKSEITLRFLAQPTEVNFGGKVHGGTVMTWIDQAGYVCAATWSGCYCVTAYVGGIRFVRPINIGQLVDVHAQIILTGRTSMHIAVDVRASDPRTSADALTTHCVIIFVAVDESGTPTPVPEWTPTTDDQHALHNYATRLMELRKSIDDEMNTMFD